MKCSCCKKEYPYTAEFFVPAKTCKNGISRKCRGCSRRYINKWRKKNRDSLLAKRREQYRTSEKVIEACRKRERWRTDPVRQRALVMQKSVVSRAKELGLALDSGLRKTAWFVGQLRCLLTCPCCGKPFDLSGAVGRGGRGPSDRSPSVDRLVPSRGYAEANVRIICWRCNNLKRDATAVELEGIALWMRQEGLE